MLLACCATTGIKAIGFNSIGSDDGRKRKTRIEKFDSLNFAFWKMQMDDYIYQKDLYIPLRGKEKKSENMTDDEWFLLDRKALGTIRLSLSKSVAFNISKMKITKELMEALATMYEKPSASNKVHLMKQLFNMKMSDGASVAKHLDEFNTVTSHLESIGIIF